jgi:hypothetical protein
MSAPTREAAPLSEQPTQPLPRLDLPPQHGAFKESGLWLFPGGPLAGISAGLIIRQFIATTADIQFAVVVALLVLLLVVTFGAFVVPKTVGRGKDGRA